MIRRTSHDTLRFTLRIFNHNIFSLSHSLAPHLSFIFSNFCFNTAYFDLHTQVENRAINEKDLVSLSVPDFADANKRKVHAFLTISEVREKRWYRRRGR